MSRFGLRVAFRGLVATGVLCGIAGLRLLAQSSSATDPFLREARQAYDVLDYEGARTQLDALVARLSEAPIDQARRRQLALAYELRARTRQNLRDLDGARADLRLMLLLVPDYPFPTEAGPRAQALFEEVRAATIGMVDVTVLPPDADVRIDGDVVAERPVRLPLVDGAHVVSATRRGHRAAEQPFTVKAGETASVTVTLERELSAITLQTSPPEVEVVLDGVARGSTLPPSGANRAEPATESAPLVLEDVGNGHHVVELKRPCTITERRELDIDRPRDVRLGVVRLLPAVGRVSVRGDTAAARIVVDDLPMGALPQTIEICEGRRVLEVIAGSLGRDVARLDVKAGAAQEFAARVRPAFAVFPNGAPSNGGVDEAALKAENAFRQASVLVFAPPVRRVAEAMSQSPPPAGWLAFDRFARPVQSSAPSVASQGAITTRMAAALDVQGIAGLRNDSTGDARDMLLTLFAPGSAQPDVIRFRTDDAASVAAAVARLDERPALTRATLGLLAIDVLDVQGAVVASVDANGSAGAAGIQPGDVVATLGGKSVASAGDLVAAAESATPGQSLALGLRDRAGAPRTVSVAVGRIPRLIDPLDQTVLANTLAVALTNRADGAASPIDAAAIRLNLAVAWMQLDNCDAAARELAAVGDTVASGTLPAALKDGITGNVQYLLGLCAVRNNDQAAAARAFTLAAQSSGALFTDGGGLLKELAQQRLATLRQP